MDFGNGFPIGYVSKSHGFKGQVKLGFFEEEYKELIINKGFLFLEIDNKGVPFLINEVEGNGLVVKLEDIDDEESARGLCGLKMLSFKKGLEKREMEIIGYALQNAKHEDVGEIIEVEDLNGNVVLHVANEKKHLLLPFHEDLLLEMNASKKILVLSIAEGLLDI